MDAAMRTDGKGGGIQCLNAVHLKILACTFMLLDHAWITLFYGSQWDWMTCVGRIAFPIFAFQLVEGFYHTHDFNKYLKRMFLFALISEIPFNLMDSGSFTSLLHQNVMFTFCLGLLFMRYMEKRKAKGTVRYIIAILVVLIVGFLVGTYTFVDYGGYGIWMIVLFYVTRDLPFGKLIQLLGMLYINCEMIGGREFIVNLAGKELFIPEQGFAVLALIFIWLYNGKPGPKSKAIQYACYAFYPLHILILALIAIARAG